MTGHKTAILLKRVLWKNTVEGGTCGKFIEGGNQK